MINEQNNISQPPQKILISQLLQLSLPPHSLYQKARLRKARIYLTFYFEIILLKNSVSRGWSIDIFISLGASITKVNTHSLHFYNTSKVGSHTNSLRYIIIGSSSQMRTQTREVQQVLSMSFPYPLSFIISVPASLLSNCLK